MDKDYKIGIDYAEGKDHTVESAYVPKYIPCEYCKEPIYIFRQSLLKPLCRDTNEVEFNFKRIVNPQYCWACGRQLFEVNLDSKLVE